MPGHYGKKRPMASKMNSKTTALRKAAKVKFGKKKATAKGYGS